MTIDIRLRAGEATPTNVVLRRSRTVTGVTRGPTGAALPFCRVHLFRTSDDLEMSETVSDANGSYSFTVHDLVAYYVLATRYSEYRADSTAYTADSFGAFPLTADVLEVTGATQNTLTGA